MTLSAEPAFLQGHTPEDIRQLDLEHCWHQYTEMSGYRHNQLVIVRGEGSYVYDIDGRRYIDAVSGLWNIQIGHGQPEVIEAIHAQAQQLAFYPLNGRTHIPSVVLSKMLVDLAPGALNKVFLSTGGAEANETAIKMSRQFWRNQGQPGKYKVVGLSRGWHGCTLGALAASGVSEEKTPFEPLAEGFVKIPAPYHYRSERALSAEEYGLECARNLLQVIEQEGAESIAAFIAEPVMGLAGMVPPPHSFWQEIQQICKQHDILLIIDEVAMGFGRTGKMFASEHYGIEPDLLTCAKGITSGYLPLSAVLTTDRIYNAFLGQGKSFIHGFTFGGHPVSCAAAIANIQHLVTHQLPERARQIGAEVLQHLQEGLKDCSIVGDIRGLGFAIAIELVEDRDSKKPLQISSQLCNELARQSILVRPLGFNNVLPLIPHLNMPRELIWQLADTYIELLTTLDQKSSAGR